MPAMTKRVNINAPIAIRTITPPIYGTCNNIVMNTGDILQCLCKRAIVDEILPDGRTVRLNMSNYYLDNGAGLDASRVVSAPAEEVVETVNEIIAEPETTVEPVEETRPDDAEEGTAIESFNSEQPADATELPTSDNAETNVDETPSNDTNTDTTVEPATTIVDAPEVVEEAKTEETPTTPKKKTSSGKKSSSTKKTTTTTVAEETNN